MRKGELTTQRALDAAEQLFADQGYEGTTVRQIAEAINIREPSLYKHFQGKEAIYAAVLERGIMPLLDEIEGWMMKQLAMTDLLSIPQRIMDLLAQHPNVAKLLQREMISNEISPVALEWFQKLFGASEQFRRALKGRSSDKQSLLYAIAMTNVALGFFASARLFEQLGNGNLLDADTIEEQSEIFAKIFKTFLIN